MQMFVLNFTNDYNNCTDRENEDSNIFVNYLLLSIPSSIILLCLMILFTWIILKVLLLNIK